MRIVYFIFVFSVFLLTGLFRRQPEVLKAPGGEEFSPPRRIAHYVVVAVIVVVSGWCSAVRLRKDWAGLKARIRDKKKKNHEP